MRVIRYNRSPESRRQRSEAQRTRRPIARTHRCACGLEFTPRVGNQKRCPDCIRRNP